MPIRIIATAATLAFIAVAPTGAWAQNVMKECGAEYQAAKAGNTLGGKKWGEFLSDCRTRHAAATNASATPTAAPAAPTAPAAPPASAAAAPPVSPSTRAAAAKKPVSGGRAAMLERQRSCGTEWKAQKVELRKTQPGLKWPQYWSECNKRLKAAATQ